MGYRIEYGQEKKGRLLPLTALWFLIFLLLVGCFWPRGREVLVGLLVPGDWDQTLEAVETGIQALRRGETLGFGVEAFCRQVLEGRNGGN